MMTCVEDSCRGLQISQQRGEVKSTIYRSPITSPITHDYLGSTRFEEAGGEAVFKLAPEGRT